MGAIAKLFQPGPRALSLSNPADASVIAKVLSGGLTRAGVSVDADTALKVGAVFACVRVLAEDVAKVPLILYRRRRQGGKERAIDHPLYTRMHRRVNGFQTAFEWRETMQGHLGLRGNAYSFVNRVRNQVVELLPIHPDRVKPKISDDWEVTYEIRKRTGGTETLPASQILHLRGLGTDGLVGLSPISLAREAIGDAIAAQQHGSAAFRNGLKPSVVATHPNELGEVAHKNLKQSIEEQATGENLFKVLLLEEGVTLTQVGFNLKDSQYIESRKFSVPEIARWYRMPLHKIQDLDRSTNNNIEHQGIEYVVDTLQAWLVRWEQRLNVTLLTEEEQEEYFFEFLIEGLLRGDSKARSEFYSKGLNDGWLSPNEVREMENRNPVPGLDEYRRAMNTEPVGTLARSQEES